jgi:hypothetical protein
MSINKPGYYGIIPAIVRYDKNLTLGARLLYCEITALCQKEGYCWATNNYFSNLYEVSERTISRWVNQLDKYKYIKIEIICKKNTKEIIERRLILTEKKAYTPIDKNVGTPIDKNVYYNNININNKIFSKEKSISDEMHVQDFKKQKTKPLKNKTPILPKTKSLPKISKRKQIQLNNKIIEQIKYWNKKVNSLNNSDLVRLHNIKPNIAIEKQTKTIQHIAKELIKKYKQGFCCDSINGTIDVFFEFLSKTNKFKHVFTGLKIGLNEYFSFNKKTKLIINDNKNNPLVGEKSWFDIISNSDCDDNQIVDYLIDKFTVTLKDLHPEITVEFKKYYLKAINKKKLSKKESEDLIHASKLFNKFKTKYSKKLIIPPDCRTLNGLISVLFELKNYDLTLQSHFLRSKTLWESEFYQLLDKAGYLK